MTQRPSFIYEKQFWNEGIFLVAGIDEVGMGALAGPVVAASVVFPANKRLRGIRDSKQLSPRQREKIAPYIKTKAICWGIGEASVKEIVSHNIRGAAILAMQRAVERLTTVPEFLLVDGNMKNIHPSIPCTGIIKGDCTCTSIAAASILAKVHRDRTMTELDVLHPQYGFASNKGYGSAAHLAALEQFGPTPHHRPTYAPVVAVLTHNNLAKPS